MRIRSGEGCIVRVKSQFLRPRPPFGLSSEAPDRSPIVWQILRWSRAAGKASRGRAPERLRFELVALASPRVCTNEMRTLPVLALGRVLVPGILRIDVED